MKALSRQIIGLNHSVALSGVDDQPVAGGRHLKIRNDEQAMIYRFDRARSDDAIVGNIHVLPIYRKHPASL